jgi:hypothetical protein
MIKLSVSLFGKKEKVLLEFFSVEREEKEERKESK